jgi:hypothetical protein
MHGHTVPVALSSKVQHSEALHTYKIRSALADLHISVPATHEQAVLTLHMRVA